MNSIQYTDLLNHIEFLQKELDSECKKSYGLELENKELLAKSLRLEKANADLTIELIQYVKDTKRAKELLYKQERQLEAIIGGEPQCHSNLKPKQNSFLQQTQILLKNLQARQNP